jgi:outer membrane protein assembly factor BamC
VTRSSLAFAVRSGTLLLALSLIGCTSIENLLSGDKIDYRTAGARTSGLEVPPDLTQLAKDTRYQQPSGTVSASAFQAGAAATSTAAAATATVAPQAVGDMHVERLGNARWLSSSLPPEKLYPLVRSFWKDNGFALVQDRPDAGVLETDWAENRAKLPNDIVRRTVGRIFDSVFSTGELDKFRTRIERTTSGSDVFITHRGMQEVYSNERKDSTVWQPRPADPQLEGEFLSRLMLKLGAKEEVAQTAATPAPAGPARARVVAGQPAATLQVDDGFDRAWRRVGLALDRSGFTVEDRDRAQGVYYVRYVDPKFAGREEPGFFSRIFSFGKKKDDESTLSRYRVAIKADGNASTVSVLDAKGAPENGPVGQRIVGLLVDDLK